MNIQETWTNWYLYLKKQGGKGDNKLTAAILTLAGVLQMSASKLLKKRADS